MRQDPITEDVTQGERQLGEPGVENAVGVRDGAQNPVLDETGGLAVDGGKLPGAKDDFDGELDDDRPAVVPGADPNNAVRPPNAQDLR